MNPLTLQERINNCISGIDVLLAKQDGITLQVTLKRVRDVLIDANKALTSEEHE